MKKSKFFLITLCVVATAGAILCTGAYLAGFRFRPDVKTEFQMDSGVWRAVTARLTETPAFQEAAGAPATPGKLIEAEAWEAPGGETGAIRLKQEFHGKKRSGTLFVEGTMTGGKWQYKKFSFRFHDGAELNLLKD